MYSFARRCRDWKWHWEGKTYTWLVLYKYQSKYWKISLNKTRDFTFVLLSLQFSEIAESQFQIKARLFGDFGSCCKIITKNCPLQNFDKISCQIFLSLHDINLNSFWSVLKKLWWKTNKSNNVLWIQQQKL